MRETLFIWTLTLPVFFSLWALMSLRSIHPIVRFSNIIGLVAGFTLSVFNFINTEPTYFINYAMGNWEAPIGIVLYADKVILFLIALVYFIALIVSFFSYERFFGVYASLFYLLLAGLLGMIATKDLFNLYVFIEVSALSAYALLATGGKRAYYAVFNYLIMSGLTASFYLIGLAIVYATSGSLNIDDIKQFYLTQNNPPIELLTLSALFIVVSLTTKAAIFPLHVWMPNVYSFAPSYVSAFIAGVMTKVNAFALFKVLIWLFLPVIDFSQIKTILLVMASVSIIYGAYMAFRSYDARRIYAFSSLSQMGYIFVGFSLGTPLSIFAALLHMAHHAINKSMLFLTASKIIPQDRNQNLACFYNLFKRSKLLGISMFISAISMIGLPPFSGFFSKLFLVKASLYENLWVIGFIVIGSLLTAVYFFRLLEHLFSYSIEDTQQQEASAELIRLTWPEKLSLALYISVLVTFIFLSHHLYHALMPSIESWGIFK